jgi:hypothetical protein
MCNECVEDECTEVKFGGEYWLIVGVVLAFALRCVWAPPCAEGKDKLDFGEGGTWNTILGQEKSEEQRALVDFVETGIWQDFNYEETRKLRILSHGGACVRTLVAVLLHFLQPVMHALAVWAYWDKLDETQQLYALMLLYGRDLVYVVLLIPMALCTSPAVFLFGGGLTCVSGRSDRGLFTGGLIALCYWLVPDKFLMLHFGIKHNYAADNSGRRGPCCFACCPYLFRLALLYELGVCIAAIVAASNSGKLYAPLMFGYCTSLLSIVVPCVDWAARMRGE